jgi:hypothetical protein
VFRTRYRLKGLANRWCRASTTAKLLTAPRFAVSRLVQHTGTTVHGHPLSLNAAHVAAELVLSCSASHNSVSSSRVIRT